MKNSIKHFSILAAALLGGTMALHAQQRYGGGGGGGGFGGYRGGGYGGYGNNSSTSSSYNNNGSVGTASIYVDPDTHSIVVSADSVTAEQISNVIASLDVAKPQVLIKVVFLEVDLNNASEIGIEGGMVNNSGGLSQSAGNVLGLSGLNSVVTNFNAMGQPMSSALSPGSSLAGSGGFYQIVGSDFQATLKAVATAGKAQVLSRPSVLARDGQLAQIVIGQSIYLPSGVTFSGTSGVDTLPTINGSYQNVGIILNVTPYIGDNRLVEMILQPEISSVDTSTPGQIIAASGLTGSPIYAPNLDVRSADTVVVTPDAQPVVIGGLIGDDKSTSVTKVPILGDIPILGNLFKSTNKNHDKTDLLIFLTPHVVETPGMLGTAPALNDKLRQFASPTNSFEEVELEQYLEHLPVKKQ